MSAPYKENPVQLQSLAHGSSRVPNIYSRNVSEALYIGLMLLREQGVWHGSRSGKVIEHPTPVVTIYRAPTERVLFYSARDANPFFHLFEALWMLGGRNDLEYVAQFNKRMADFSDDGVTLNGAYGQRWRSYWGRDQLDLLLEHFTQHPDSRRGVLQMWSVDDLQKIVDKATCKDVPCNTQVYFKIRKGTGSKLPHLAARTRLDMTVTCRSNDIIWGTYGANAVHFSILQEYMAARLGIPVGTYYHLSDSFHAYEDVFNSTLAIVDQRNPGDPLWYDSYLGWNDGKHYTPPPMFTEPESIDTDLQAFLSRWLCDDESPTYKNAFFGETATPMLQAWYLYKHKNYDGAIALMQKVRAKDWRKAGTEWIERRRKKWNSQKL